MLTYRDFETRGRGKHARSPLRAAVEYGPFDDLRQAAGHARRLGLRRDGIGFSSKRRIALASAGEGGGRLYLRVCRRAG